MNHLEAFKNLASGDVKYIEKKWYNGHAYFPLYTYEFIQIQEDIELMFNIELLDNESSGYSSSNYTGAFMSANKYSIKTEVKCSQKGFIIEFRKGLADALKLGKRIAIKGGSDGFKNFINDSNYFINIQSYVAEERWFGAQITSQKVDGSMVIEATGMLNLKEPIKGLSLVAAGIKEVITYINKNETN